MAAYLELHLKGGGVALVEAGSICAAIARGTSSAAPGTPESPTLVVIRGGETLEVIGQSPQLVIGRVVMARKTLREMPGAEVYVDFLTPMGEHPDEHADREPA